MFSIILKLAKALFFIFLMILPISFLAAAPLFIFIKYFDFCAHFAIDSIPDEVIQLTNFPLFLAIAFSLNPILIFSTIKIIGKGNTIIRNAFITGIIVYLEIFFIPLFQSFIKDEYLLPYSILVIDICLLTFLLVRFFIKRNR